MAAAVLWCSGAGAEEPDEGAPLRTDSRSFIVVAVDNPLVRLPRGGITSYGGSARYVVGSEAAATLTALEREHKLQAAAAWPIVPLGWHCVVYAVPTGIERDTLVQALARDARVRLVQPLQDFTTLTRGSEVPGSDGASPAQPYNDPYVDLQRGFVQTAAAQAHRTSTGRRVAVAVVDTGVDLRHPDLAGRIAAHRDLVGTAGTAAFEQERHGTEVAGIIAAAANNGQGIVGIAPGAQLSLYRACWYPQGVADRAARCNSFTLAKALAAVLESDARIVNLSLGGPSDPLLEALLRKLFEQRRIVIGALPTGGRREGFPAGVPGVIVVGAAGKEPLPVGALSAPGRDILTLVPGGRYDFSSGSSIAAAHVTGIAALLLALEPQLDGTRMQALLAGATSSAPDACVNAESAVTTLAQRIEWASALH